MLNFFKSRLVPLKLTFVSIFHQEGVISRFAPRNSIVTGLHSAIGSGLP